MPAAEGEVGVCLRVFSDRHSQRMRKVPNQRTRIVVSVKELDRLCCNIVCANDCTVVTPPNIKVHHITLLLIHYYLFFLLLILFIMHY